MFALQVSSGYWKTNDASQLLLHSLGANGWEMWEGGGDRYIVGTGGHVSGFNDSLADYVHDFGRSLDGWYLTALTDPFGNSYSVSYQNKVSPCWQYAGSCGAVNPREKMVCQTGSDFTCLRRSRFRRERSRLTGTTRTAGYREWPFRA
jgi:hypothetical protein